MVSPHRLHESSDCFCGGGSLFFAGLLSGIKIYGMCKNQAHIDLLTHEIKSFIDIDSRTNSEAMYYLPDAILDQQLGVVTITTSVQPRVAVTMPDESLQPASGNVDAKDEEGDKEDVDPAGEIEDEEGEEEDQADDLALDLDSEMFGGGASPEGQPAGAAAKPALPKPAKPDKGAANAVKGTKAAKANAKATAKATTKGKTATATPSAAKKAASKALPKPAAAKGKGPAAAKANAATAELE